MSEINPVVIFTAPQCPHSRAAVHDLQRRGVRFREVDVTRETDGLEQLEQLTWEHRLPVIVDHERVTIGWQGRSSTLADLGLE